MKILHIEDHDLYISLAKKLFSDFSYQNVKSGEDALKLLDVQSFDVIICDGNLTGDLTGWDTVKLIREKKITTPIIACSNVHNKTIKEAGANISANKDILSTSEDMYNGKNWTINSWIEDFQSLGLTVEKKEEF